MIQLKILSGSTADAIQIVRRFPFRIGRAPDNDLRLEAPGVWDHHLTLEFQKSEGFILRTAPEAFAAINEEQKQSARLRNSDLISFGSAKIQFWLAAPRQRGLHLRELFVWLLLLAVTAFQFVLIYRLIR
jgi:pSer/pThr/pTyr-binding forkhead associated (FHA) protein